MNQRLRDPLDRALGSLPTEVAPEKDLWAQIEAQISASPPIHQREHRVDVVPRRHFNVSSRWLQMAAAVLLIAGSSFTTWVIVQRSANERVMRAQQSTVQQMQPVLNAMPASFGGADALGADYQKARAALCDEFDRRVAKLPPVTRARLERDLADLRRAANHVAATLGQHPGDPLLQQLLLSTYQSELALLGSLNDVSTPETVGVDL
ncbi:MAG: hypothetical protein ABW106_08350 [Steroidobacteraceae bacterium]